jgi:outer membrane protein OmpA-like peptidoglycan-associated protein
MTMMNFNHALRRSLWAVGTVFFLLWGLSACQSAPTSKGKVVANAGVRLTDQQVSVLRKLGFTEQADAWTFDISDSKLLFDFGHDTLSAAGAAIVSDIARGLVEVGLTHIKAEGHTDNVGSVSYNIGLSMRRAEHVARQLVAGGFQDVSVVRAGFGATKPVAENTTPEGRAQNRRVSLIVAAD